MPDASGILMEMTIDQVRAFNPEVVVLPIGSTEPHGPHLPYGTDVYEATGASVPAVKLANERGARALLYPTLPIGNNVNFKAYPFACRIRVRTLMNVVLDVIEAVQEDGVRKVMIVNNHGGNTDTLRATLREQVDRHGRQGAFVCLANPMNFASPQALKQIEHFSLHAGETETSLMMHHRPDLVREDLFEDFEQRRATIEQLEGSPIFWVRDWPSYLPTSAGGETRSSSADKGRQLVETATEGMAQFLCRLSQEPWHERFPFPAE